VKALTAVQCGGDQLAEVDAPIAVGIQALADGDRRCAESIGHP
jgi:hypothetical protein